MSSPDIVVRFDRKGLILVAALVLIGGTAGMLWSESLTLVTTYPAPSGIYNQIVTTGNSGAVPANTVINRNAGNTLLVPATNAGGMVGIGRTPVSKLSIAGGVQLGDDLAVCTAEKAGTQRWHSGSLQVCDGLGWNPIGGAVQRGQLFGSCIQSRNPVCYPGCTIQDTSGIVTCAASNFCVCAAGYTKVVTGGVNCINVEIIACAAN